MASLPFSVDRTASCLRVQCPVRNASKRRDLSFLLLVLLQETLDQALSFLKRGKGLGWSLVAEPLLTSHSSIKGLFGPILYQAVQQVKAMPTLPREPTRRGQKVGYMASLPITKESAIEVAD